jgi:Transcription factor WhiB
MGTWMAAAACAGKPLAWFVDQDAGTRDESWLPPAEALACCEVCPVAGDCLDEALRDQLVGCWGGTSTKVRRQLHRPRKRLACPKCREPGLVVPLEGDTQACIGCAVSWRAA